MWRCPLQSLGVLNFPLMFTKSLTFIFRNQHTLYELWHLAHKKKEPSHIGHHSLNNDVWKFENFNNTDYSRYLTFLTECDLTFWLTYYYLVLEFGLLRLGRVKNWSATRLIIVPTFWVHVFPLVNCLTWQRVQQIASLI